MNSWLSRQTSPRAFAYAFLLPAAVLLAASPIDGRDGEVVPESSGQVSAHFAFLPPVGTMPAIGGVFDPTLHPQVQICEMTADRCSLVARFTMESGQGPEIVRLDAAAEQYVVQWQTGRYALNSNLHYRIRVLVVGFEIGFADVDLIENSFDLWTVDRTRFVPVVKGSTVPIKFRIEKDVLLGQPDAALVQQARDLLTAMDPVSAYQALMEGIAALFQQVGPDEGQRRLDLIIALAFDPVGDRERIHQVQLALGGREFSASPGDPAGNVLAADDEPRQKPITTVIFINGLMNSFDDGWAGYFQLENAMRALPPVGLGWNVIGNGSRGDADYRLAHVYNPTNPVERAAACAWAA